MFESALVPVSLREPVGRVRLLVDFLRNFGTRSVTLLHVVSSGLESAWRAERRLGDLRDALDSESYEMQSLVRHGSPAQVICDAAEERGLRYVCVPWKRKSMLKRALLGSTTANVARLTEVPLFVYKPVGPAVERTRLESVLCATTLEPGRDGILPYLRDEGFSARHLYLLHVGWRAPDPETESRRRKTVHERLAKLEGACEGCFETIQAITRVGDPRRRILRAERTYGVELIVLGKRARPGGLNRVLGSTAERIVHEARGSVLVVPPREPGPEDESP